MNSEVKKEVVISKHDIISDIENDLPFNMIDRIKQIPNISSDTVLEFEGKFEDNKTEISDSLIIDHPSICHVCLCSTNENISLVPSCDQELAYMYTFITSIEISTSAIIYFRICDTCRTDIIHCYRFKLKCVKSLHSLQKSCQTKICEDENENTSIEDIQIKTEVKEHKLSDIMESTKQTLTMPSDLKDEYDISEDNIEYLESEYFETSPNAKVLEINQVTDVNGKDVMKKEEPGTTKYYYCDICQKKFHKEKGLKIHLRSHNSDNDTLTHSCNKCKEAFGSAHDLNVHSALHAKGSKWTCNKCLKEFNERGRLRRHIRRHFERKGYSCAWCGKQFAELYALRRHSRVHTGERADKTHQCTQCDKRYAHKSQLRAHMSSHSGARPCACDTCGKRFPSRRLLDSHRLVHTDLKPYECAYCGKRFRHESTRNTHHRTHTGEKPYVCSICGKTFIQNSNLTLHMRTHTGEKPYSCETCGRTFKSGSSLTNHMRTHSGEKPYECSICGKRLARASMTNHMRRHTGERAHACCVCRKSFVCASRLREHARTHTGEKPFKCTLCPVQYTKESCLTKHIKKHEKDKNSGNVLFVHKVPVIVTDKMLLNKEPCKPIGTRENLQLQEDEPVEVSGELILQDDSNVKTELLVIDDGDNNISYQSEVIADTYTSHSEINNINLVSVNEGDLASSALLEGTTVKLFRLDQNLVEIHTSDDQITISKLASKITTKY